MSGFDAWLRMCLLASSLAAPAGVSSVYRAVRVADLTCLVRLADGLPCETLPAARAELMRIGEN